MGVGPEELRRERTVLCENSRMAFFFTTSGPSPSRRLMEGIRPDLGKTHRLEIDGILIRRSAACAEF